MIDGVEMPPSLARERSSAQVLILAPTANDARLTVDFLQKAGFDTEACRDFEELRDRAGEGCGCIVLAEETLKADAVRILVATLERQPSWSDIPVILVTSGGEASRERLRRLALLGPSGNVSVLERPFRPNTLVSAIAVALKSRTRQYEVRDLLAALGKARDEAEHANRTKDEFLAALSHELRTPLNPVLLLADAGAEDHDLPQKAREDFAVIRKNVNLEARLIDDLLDLTRISRGKLKLDLVRCDLHEILRDAIRNVQGDAREKNIPISQEFSALQTELSGDPVRLQQVFWNVLRNAVKFTPPNGQIHVSTAQVEGQLLAVCIRDSGIGLAETELESIFEAFSQGQHGRDGGENRYGGLGLGLSISRMLVELHGGQIRAESEGYGLGSVFTIELPGRVWLSDEALPEMGRDIVGVPESLSPSRRQRVLLVEDHEDTRYALNFLLGRDYDVVMANSAAEARSRAAEGDFDLVVSDIGLPDETGYALMSFLRREYRLKGIALTGYGMEEDVMRSQEAGFIAHLTKPVEYSTLERTMKKAFASLDGFIEPRSVSLPKEV